MMRAHDERLGVSREARAGARRRLTARRQSDIKAFYRVAMTNAGFMKFRPESAESYVSP